MSLKIPLNNLSDVLKEKIEKDLQIKIESKTFSSFNNSNVKYLYPYYLQDGIVSVPFFYGINTLKLKSPERNTFPKRIVKFNGKLYEHQKEVKNNAIKQLNKTGSIIISMGTGMGKTITSINIATKLKFKTLVVVNKIVLMKQWKESIESFCEDVKVQSITPKTKIKDDIDFYIVNCMNIPKLDKSFLSEIGCCIIDEVHLIVAEKLSRSLLNLSPRYCIALSATPYRIDGLNILLDLYFGTNKIVKKLRKKHTVYKIKTNIYPEVDYTANGKINWNLVIDSLSNNVERNEMIINIVKKNKDRNILILVKRISQGEYLNTRLLEEDINVETLLGDKQEFDKNCQTLIGTSSKVGTGFDFKKLDCLILAIDIKEYFSQFLGRIFRRNDIEPIVFDLVDNNSIIQNHFRTRKKTYTDLGGIINTDYVI